MHAIHANTNALSGGDETAVPVANTTHRVSPLVGQRIEHPHLTGTCTPCIADYLLMAGVTTSAKINISYSILFHLTTSYSSYFGGKKGISRNKTSFFLLMK